MNACDVGRERVHAHFDETPDAPPPESLQLHFATCPGCRALFDDLASVRSALRLLPRPELPGEALEQVWERTVRRQARWFDGWQRAAVAAVLVTGVSLSALWLLRGSQPAGPTPAEIAQAEAQADLVFSYTARALAATRSAATRDVVGSKVSPAVRGDVPTGMRKR